MFESLARDIRYTGRWLRRSPGFSLVAVLSLGLGIGFNTAIFALVDALLLRPLPVGEPARLVDLYTSGADGDAYSTSSVPDLDDFRQHTEVFEGIAAFSPMFSAVSRDDRARLVLGEVVSGNYFTLLGVHARLGRTLLPEDDVPGASRAAVVSSSYWQRELGADPTAIGRTLRIRGQSFTIVGVLDPSFAGMVPLLAPAIWVPVQYVEDVEPAGINENLPSPTGVSRLDRRGQRWLFSKARLKPGVTVEQAQANVEVVAAGLRAAHPQTNRDRRVTVRRSSEIRIHPEADSFMAWIVSGTMAAVGLVLVIACANVAGMLLARASARQREIGIRLAIGAARSRLVRQLVTESVVLGGLGTLVGIALAWWLTRLLTSVSLPLPIPLALDLRIDLRVLGFTALTGILTGILAGVVPALKATRPGLVADLKGERAAERVGGRRWTALDALVVGQVAVAALLLVMSGLLGRSLRAAERADFGFPTGGLAILSADTEMLRYTPEGSRRFWDEARLRLAAIPGVDGVALASRLPFSLNFSWINIAVPDRQKSADEMGASIFSAIVSPDYFRTLGIGVVEGRVFAETDTPESPRVAVISEAMARRFWPGERAVGKVVYERTLDSGRTFEIVGVVADHKQQSVGEPPLPTIYRATTQRPSGFNVIVARTSGDEQALLGRMRETLLALEPGLLFLDNQTMNAQVSATLFPVRAAAVLLTVFSALALLLASIGLYGVIAFAVTRRTREIGIRLAIGAPRRSVLAMVMRQGLILATVGLGAGLVLAAAATRIVAGGLYGTGAYDPVAWTAASVVLLAIAALANFIPARRAMRIDPVDALRTE
jgi:macrolide transport system ATP-binding/permease protein